MTLLLNNWFFWSLLATLCTAIIAHFNHRHRLDPQLLNAWHSTFAALMLAAAIPFTIWPDFFERKSFYIMGVLNGVVLGLGMIFFFKLAMRRTGRVTSMTIPIAAVAAYTAWWVLDPNSRPAFLDSPWRGYLTLLSMMCICFAMQKVRQNDASWETFLLVLPIGMAFGVRDALVKWTIGAEMQVYASAISFLLISALVWAGLAWIAAMPKPPGGREPVRVRPLLWGSFWCAFWTVGMLLANIIALIRAPNPAYPGIVMAMTPLWLYAYYYLRGIRDETSPVAGAVIILGAVGLLLSTV